MYTSYIGSKFLEIYNRKMATEYTAEAFFDEVMFPLFFDHKQHLMTVHGSAFFQPKLDDLKPENRVGLSENEARYRKMRRDINEVVAGTQTVSAKLFVGGPAEGSLQTTSGQVTNLNPIITSEELYASWIGNALAVRVEGSQCLLIDSEPVLWHLFEGWQVYRNYMKPVKEMAGRQIETWNGYWLAKGDLTKTPTPPTKGSKIETYPWVVVIAGLLKWHAGEVMPLYIYSLGQTNTTYGFININLPQIKRLQDAEVAIHKSMTSREEKDEASFWEKYIPDFSLRDVCQFGEIGLRGLRPLDYGKIMEAQFTTTKINDKNIHLFSNIETWLIAMINNKTELQKLASELASELLAAEEKSPGKPRGKAADAETKALFDARGLTSFVNAMSDLIQKHGNATTVGKSAVDQILRIPMDQFPLFKALLRFEYIFASKN